MLNKKDTKLILLTNFYPFGKGETFLETEIQFLSASFKEVLIVSSSLSSEKTRETAENVKCQRFNPRNSKRKYIELLNWYFLKEFIINMFSNPLKNKIAINSWLNACNLASVIEPKINSNTILYSYWLDDSALALSILKYNNEKLKVVSRAHRWDIYEEEHLYEYLPFRKFLFKQLNSIYSISLDGISYLTAKGANNIELSRLGTIQTKTPEVHSQTDTLNVLSISYLIKRKRISLLADAIKLLDTEGKKITWTHFGDGPEMEELKSSISDIKYIPIDFKGFVSNTGLLEWLSENAATSLLVNLSESEGIPVSMMEAMSFGIPCMGTDVGGVSEIIQDEKNGYLLPATPSASIVADKLASYYELKKTEKIELKQNAIDSWRKHYNANKNFTDFCEKLLNL